jgi:hypothetical protein
MVFAVSLSISDIVSIRYRLSVIMYLLFTSPIPLSTKLEGNLQNFSLNSLLICAFKTGYSAKSHHRRLALQLHSDNASLHFALSHNALAQRRKVIVSLSYRF